MFSICDPQLPEMEPSGGFCNPSNLVMEPETFRSQSRIKHNPADNHSRNKKNFVFRLMIERFMCERILYWYCRFWHHSTDPNRKTDQTGISPCWQKESAVSASTEPSTNESDE